MCNFLAKGLDHIAEMILSYLDAKSLCAAELVSKEWNRVICDGMMWRKLIEQMVRIDPLWSGLSERRGWYEALFYILMLTRTRSTSTGTQIKQLSSIEIIQGTGL